MNHQVGNLTSYIERVLKSYRLIQKFWEHHIRGGRARFPDKSIGSHFDPMGRETCQVFIPFAHHFFSTPTCVSFKVGASLQFLTMEPGLNYLYTSGRWKDYRDDHR